MTMPSDGDERRGVCLSVSCQMSSIKVTNADRKTWLAREVDELSSHVAVDSDYPARLPSETADKTVTAIPGIWASGVELKL